MTKTRSNGLLRLLVDESTGNAGITEDEEKHIGKLSNISAKCLMEVMYMARLERG